MMSKVTHVAIVLVLAWSTHLAAETEDPFVALEYVDQVHPPYPEKEVKQWLQQAWKGELYHVSAASVILRKAGYFQKQPYGREQIKKAAFCLAEEMPSLALKYVDAYKDQSYAAQVVRKSIAADVWGALENDSLLKDFPGQKDWLKEAVLKAAKASPGKLLSLESRLMVLPYGPQSISDAVHASVEEDPGHFLYFAASHPAHPAVTQQAIEKAARGAIGRSPWATTAVLANVKLFRDKPYRAEVVEKAVRIMAERDPRMTVYSADAFMDEPFAAEILNRLVDSCKGDIFGGVHFFKKKAYAAEIVWKAAGLAPWLALEHLNEYKDQAYAKAVIQFAASKSSMAVMLGRGKIKELRFGNDLLQKAESQLFASKEIVEKCFIWERSELFDDKAKVRKFLEKVNEKECQELVLRRDG